jgi:hypothetical protein
MNIDAADIVTLVGVALLGVAMYLATGWIGLLAYAGAICLVAGLMWARDKGVNSYRRRGER